MAPPGSATAAAAQVSNVAGISSSGAQADESKSDAQATGISVAGKPVPQTGGSQSGEGESGGAAVDTGSAQAPRVKVAPWKASAKGSKAAARRSSRASSALAEVEVPDTLKVGLLTSDAAAEHSAEQSTGTSSSNAADISHGTHRVVLLHSEVDSNAKGHSYLAGVGGSEIGTEEQLSDTCALDVAGVAALSCLTVAGGVANGVTTGSAEVLGVKTALGLDPVSAFTTTGTSAAGSITPPPTILEQVAAAPAGEVPRAAAAVTPAPAPAPELPRTGVAAGSLAASGATGLAGGLLLRRLGRRRRTA